VKNSRSETNSSFSAFLLPAVQRCHNTQHIIWGCQITVLTQSVKEFIAINKKLNPLQFFFTKITLCSLLPLLQLSQQTARSVSKIHRLPVSTQSF